MTSDNTPRPTGDAPERIWVDPDLCGDGWTRDPQEHDPNIDFEYVRADLAVPRWHRIDDPDNPPPKDGCLAFYEADKCIYDIVWCADRGKWVSRDSEITNFHQPDFTWWTRRAPPEGET
mgnify:CR=1 FL=1